MTIDFHTFVENFIFAVEAKDVYTAGHSDRVADITLMIAKQMDLEESFCHKTHMAAHLHDIGKIGIADGILLKSGKLTKEEFAVMKTHSEIGFNILHKNKNLQDIAAMILHHHERYDGSGYPDGLSAEDIPLGARIIAVADAFDAMVTRRTYKEKMSISTAIDEIERERGKQFDPGIASAFLDMLKDSKQLKEIEDIVETVVQI